ncbi:hypothetical protein [Streptomyces sp. NPDC001401]|uniref:hypothetical protein n=1 Tax=Streptomyces sp. NPDC001401 TaxID=3364570 RepID=UPI00367D7C55
MLTPSEGDGQGVIEILDADRPLFRELWRALSRRARAAVAASACLVVLTSLAGYFLSPRPASPAPVPAAGISVRITHVSVPKAYNPYFGITLRAAATSLVSVEGTREGYENLILYVPLPGSPLAPGQARTLHVRAAVCNCWLPRPPHGTPLLYLTVRTSRGDRHLSVVPTPAQYAQLDLDLRRSCTS